MVSDETTWFLSVLSFVFTTFDEIKMYSQAFKSFLWSQTVHCQHLLLLIVYLLFYASVENISLTWKLIITDEGLQNLGFIGKIKEGSSSCNLEC